MGGRRLECLKARCRPKLLESSVADALEAPDVKQWRRGWSPWEARRVAETVASKMPESEVGADAGPI